jgi:hypothetical protein
MPLSLRGQLGRASNMTKFLRFEIGGASALLWMILFLIPRLNIGALIQVDAVKLFAVIFGSITLSIPLGNYIHQFTDAVFNPFKKTRLLLWPRAVIVYINSEIGRDASLFRDNTLQAVLVFSKAHSRSRKTMNEMTDAVTRETTIDLRVEIIREEIANRYSYYYARLENGAVAPVLGALFSILVVRIFEATAYIRETPAFSPLWIVLGAVLGGLPILWRIPKLFRELDDLEISLVALQRDCWPSLAGGRNESNKSVK